jgi:hypothetical protein
MQRHNQNIHGELTKLAGSGLNVQLVNVPAGVNEIDVLAAVALRVPIESTEAGEQRGRGPTGKLG